MTKRMRLQADTNFWMVYFLKYEQLFEPCARIVEMAAAERIELLVAPSSVKDVFYLIPRALRRMDSQEGRGSVSYRPAAWACVEFMLDTATPSPQGVAECEKARMLRQTIDDFEDGLILASAESAGADFVLTYDHGLLEQLPEVFVTPSRALELMEIGLGD